MRTSQVVAFLLFAAVAAGTPGPSNFILASTAAAVGTLRGLPALLGQTFGMAVMLFLVGFGLGSIVLRTPAILQVLKLCAVAFLLLLAFMIATARNDEARRTRLRFGFWRAAAFQWVNPKAWLICAAAASGYLPAGASHPLVPAAVLSLLFLAVALLSCFPWLAAGGTLQRFLHTPGASRVFNITMALLLVASVVLVLK